MLGQQRFTVSANTDQPIIARPRQRRFAVRPPRDLRRALALAWRGFSVFVVVVGVGFAGYACVQWLETARWQPLTVNRALSSWPATREWAAHPHAWLGLHRIVMWVRSVPIFLLTTAIGVVFILLGAPSPRARRYDDW